MNLATQFLDDSHKTALIDGSDIYTFEQLNKASRSLAAGLIEDEKISPNNRVVIIAHNSAEFIIAYLAVLISGAIAIPLDPHAHAGERAHDISLVRPNLIITSSRDWIPEAYEEKVHSLEFHSSAWRSYLTKKPTDPVLREKTDVAVMMMTSGASFQPRPAMLTHGSLGANLRQAQSVDALKLSSSDVVLSALPMYHIFGLHVVLGMTMNARACAVIARSLDAVELALMVQHNKVTVVPGVPLMFEAFAHTPQVTLDSFSKVRSFISGGAPMRSDVKESFYERFGVHVSEGYGLTEASPMVSFTSHARTEGDIGTPLDGVDVDVRDSSGDAALVGDVGQIVVHGENVFAGYYADKEATARVLDSNGWLFTGDIGTRNEDGSITLIDRSHDVIVVHGFSVFPSEVENVLTTCELVEEVSVVGELDEKSGEAVVAHIVMINSRDDMTDPRVRRRAEKDLREFCKEHLARYKIPSRFIFSNELELRASGRPLRKSLRSALRNIE